MGLPKLHGSAWQGAKTLPLSGDEPTDPPRRRLAVVAGAAPRPRKERLSTRVSRKQLEFERLMAPAEPHERPRLRDECRDAPRPCPYVGCRHHLFLDVNPRTGQIQLNFPGFGLEDLVETCALDVAERDETPAEAVGGYMNLSAERVRQIEQQALDKLETSPLRDEA